MSLEVKNVSQIKCTPDGCRRSEQAEEYYREQRRTQPEFDIGSKIMFLINKNIQNFNFGDLNNDNQVNFEECISGLIINSYISVIKELEKLIEEYREFSLNEREENREQHEVSGERISEELRMLSNLIVVNEENEYELREGVLETVNMLEIASEDAIEYLEETSEHAEIIRYLSDIISIRNRMFEDADINNDECIEFNELVASLNLDHDLVEVLVPIVIEATNGTEYIYPEVFINEDNEIEGVRYPEIVVEIDGENEIQENIRNIIDSLDVIDLQEISSEVSQVLED
ncbi:hypothetical protein ACFL56_01035 [Candidatus Margulisiibacteriota bacterium]